MLDVIRGVCAACRVARWLAGRHARPAAAVVLSLVLAACHGHNLAPAQAPRVCRTLGPAQPERVVRFIAPAAGLMHFEIYERGITTVAWLEPDASGVRHASPIERLGVIDLVAPVRRAERLAVHVRAADDPQVSGSLCIGAELSPAGAERSRAVVAASRAAEQSSAARWQAAFDDYGLAARLFDAAGLPSHAARARHAMAELAFAHLQRSRDAYALVSSTLAPPERGNAVQFGVRLELLARIETRLSAELSGARPAALRGAAAGYFERSGVAAREMPRLEILEGFERYTSGDLSGAGRQFAEAASRCRELHDAQCFANALQDTAALAEEQQNYFAALSAYEQALAALDPGVRPWVVADISDNLGRLKGRIGLVEGAEQAQRTAMRLYAQLGDCDGVRRSGSSLGELLVRVGSLGDADGYLGQLALGCPELMSAVLKDPRPERRPGDPATPLRRCAPPAAIGELDTESAVAIFRTFMARSEMATLASDPVSAERCLQIATAYAREPRTRMWLANSLGEVSLARNRPVAAAERFSAALAIAEEADLPQLSSLRGTALLGAAQAGLARGDVKAATARGEQALHLSAARGDISQLVASLRVLASAYSAAGQRERALATLRLAVRLLEQVPVAGLDPEQRTLYLATQHAIFGELTQLLLADAATRPAGAPTNAVLWSAFLASEAGRARSLRYAAGAALSARSADAALAGDERFRALLASITQLSAAGSSSDPLLDRLIRLELPANTDAPLSPQSLSRSLGADHATLVEYATAGADLYAFVVDERGIQVVRLAPRAAVAQAGAALADALRAAEPEPVLVRSAATKLSRLVLWPLSAHLGARIVFAPEDALYTVPFAILPWSQATPGELLVQHAESTSIASAEIFATSKDANREHTARPQFVLLGDPVFRRPAWMHDCASRAPAVAAVAAEHAAAGSAFEWARWLPSLPGTRAEVLGIADVIRKSRADAHIDTLLRCDATAAALRSAAPAAEVLHVATHGLVDARRPRLSALALTPDSAVAPDSAFRLLDILDLHLRARLVVLSACDTSSGRLLPGEGVVGLAQAFLQAGARSVVASYWRVPDATTAPFMTSFYEYLLQRHLSAAAALRRAQLDRLEGGDPYGWAAFGLYGQSDTTL